MRPGVSTLQQVCRGQVQQRSAFAKQLMTDLVTPLPNRSNSFYDLLVTNSSAPVTPSQLPPNPTAVTLPFKLRCKQHWH